MTATNTATTLNSSASDATDTGKHKQVARPLHVLQPLIAKDLREGNEAAKQAAMPYYKAAGEKLLEAKAQIPHGEFQDWCKRNFKIKPRLAQYYMAHASTTADDEKRNALHFLSLKDFIKQTSTPRFAPKPAGIIAEETRQRWVDEEKQAREEREEKRKLALKLIDRGYKFLAAELHPDKGGSQKAMARLNFVRNHLSKFV